MTDCRHDAITVLLEEGGGPGRMWSCADCGRRFYPACSVCISVGHRNEDHVETEAVAARNAEIAEAVRGLEAKGGMLGSGPRMHLVSRDEVLALVGRP